MINASGFLRKNGILKANNDIIAGILKAFDKSELKEEDIFKAVFETAKMLEEGGLLAKGEFSAHCRELKGSMKFLLIFIEMSSPRLASALEKLSRDSSEASKKSSS